MKVKQYRTLVSAFYSRLQAIFGQPRKTRRAEPWFRPILETLEGRINPSTFTEDNVARILTITLDAPSETLSLVKTASSITIGDVSGTTPITPNLNAVGGGLVVQTTPGSPGSATITAIGLSGAQSFIEIDIVDKLGTHGAQVAFANSGANAYSGQNFIVNLTNDNQSGNVTFAGSNTFTNQSLTVATNGNILSATGSSLSMTGADGNLSLTAGNDGTLLKNVQMAGTLTVSGATTLTGYNILANATGVSYTFTGALSLNVENSVHLNAAGALTLGTSNLATNQAGLAAAISTIAASGNITQGTGTTVAVTAGNNSPVNLTSTGGNIDLSDNSLNNTFSGTPGTGAIGLSVTGTHTASIAGSGSGGAGTIAISLGAVTTGTGLLTVIATNGDINQGMPNLNTLSQPLNLGGGASFTSLSAGGQTPGNFNLGTELNNITGPITFTDPDGLSTVALRNISLTPPVPTLTNAITGLTLIYDNAGLALPGNIAVGVGGTGTGHVFLSAGGDITQGSGPFTITAVTAQFTVTNDAVINLASAVNAISGAVSFNADNGESDQAVSFLNAGDTILGTSTLGRGSFTVTTTAAGNITESGAITQAKAGGAVTFNAAGSTVDVSTQNNDFTGTIQATGAALTTFNIDNADDQAKLTNILALPATVANFAALFNNAPINVAPAPGITFGSSAVVVGTGNVTPGVSPTFANSAVVGGTNTATPGVSFSFNTTAVLAGSSKTNPNTINLGSSANVQVGQQFIYKTTDTTPGDMPVAGLVPGNLYQVFSVTTVTNNKLIQLATAAAPSKPITLTPGTTTTDKNATESLGLVNTINLGTSPNVQVGQQFTYQTNDTTPGDIPVGGLVNNTLYQILSVTTDGSSNKLIQVTSAATPGSAITLIPGTTTTDKNATETLLFNTTLNLGPNANVRVGQQFWYQTTDTAPGDNPVLGLVNNTLYQILSVSTDNSWNTLIQLATPGAPGTPLILTPATKGNAATATETLILNSVTGETGTLDFTGNLTLETNFGIYENNGPIIDGGLTTLATSGPTPILLSAANDFKNVTVSNGSNTTGNVVLNDINAINFSGSSNIGSGRLTVTAPTGITESGGAGITTGGLASFTSASGSISLDQVLNSFGGRVDASVTGANTLTLGEGGGSLILGNITTGSALNVNSADTDGGTIVQAPGTSLQIGGASTFGNSDNGGGITLTNASTNTALSNLFTGLVSLNDLAGDISITSVSGLTLAASSIGGSLTVNAGGSITQPGGAIHVTGNASFNAGAAAITLANASNTFGGDVNLSSLGTGKTPPAVQLSATGNLTLGTVTLGSGTFTVIGTGNILEAIAGAITQTGAGAISLTSATTSTNSVTLDGNGVQNNFLGTVTVAAPGGNGLSVDVQNRGDLILAVPHPLGGALVLVAGGIVTLPVGLTNLTSLSVEGSQVLVTSNIATSAGGVSFQGSVTFKGTGIAIDTSNTPGDGISFQGNVDATQSGGLTFNVQGADVVFGDGVWKQGANNLTITNTASSAADNLQLGTSVTDVFAMTSGTISTPNDGVVNVNFGTFKVGNTTATEIVKVRTGGGNMTLALGTGLEIGLGTNPDQLDYLGTANFVLNENTLTGDGPATSTRPVILNADNGGAITGNFAGSFDLLGNPSPFFIGSDFVTATYMEQGGFPVATQVVLTHATPAVLAAEAVAVGTQVFAGEGTGIVTGVTALGDTFMVTSSLGNAAGLLVQQDPNSALGALQIVVTSTSTASSTLTISLLTGSTTTYHFGQLAPTPVSFGPAPPPLVIDGLGVDTTGSVSIIAPFCDLIGDLTTTGTLSSLQVLDVGIGPKPVTITGGGPSSGATTITAQRVQNTLVNLPGVLSSFTAASVISIGGFTSSLQAQSFGSITTTTNPLLSSPTNSVLSDGGDFDANLTSRNTTGAGLASASIAGTVSGVWDLGGTVGPVTASAANNWQLGVAPAPLSVNGDRLTSIASLTLGEVTDSGINATGGISSITTADINGLNVQAQSLGSLNDTGDSALNLNGNAVDLNLTLLCNPGTTLANLTINGSLTSSTILANNVQINKIVVMRQVLDSTITAGGITSITAGDWSDSDIDAAYVSSLVVMGNLSAGLGNFDGSTVTLHGNTGNTALQTFNVVGNAQGNSINILAGNVGTITVGRTLDQGSINLSDPNTGNVTSITVGQWGANGNESLIASTVGSLKVIGAAGSLASGAPNLLATLANSTLTLYNARGTALSLGSLTVMGPTADLGGTVENDSIIVQSSTGSTFARTTAMSGIGTITVSRDISGTTIIADDYSPTQSGLGKIGSVTVGALGTNGGNVLIATFLGTVAVNGFTTPEGAEPRTDGDMVNTTLQINGNANFATASTLPSLKVVHNVTLCNIVDPYGISALTVTGSINTSFIDTENVSNPKLGVLNTLTAGDMEGNLGGNGTVIRASIINQLQTLGSTPLGLLGSISNTSIFVTGFSTGKTLLPTLSSLSVAGDLSGSQLDAPGQVNTIKVFGQVANTQLAAATQGNASINSLVVGQWGGGLVNGVGVNGSTLTSATVLSLQAIGNISRGFAGSFTGYFDIFSNIAGTALQNLTASGGVQNSTFRVADGSVTSFTAKTFTDSQLFVGARLKVAGNLAAAQWNPTAMFSINSFTTTATTGSFARSTVVAANLGTITLTSVIPSSLNPAAVMNPAILSPVTFGVGFMGSGGAKGTLSVNGAILVTPTAYTLDLFNYLAL